MKIQKLLLSALLLTACVPVGIDVEPTATPGFEASSTPKAELSISPTPRIEVSKPPNIPSTIPEPTTSTPLPVESGDAEVKTSPIPTSNADSERDNYYLDLYKIYEGYAEEVEEGVRNATVSFLFKKNYAISWDINNEKFTVGYDNSYIEAGLKNFASNPDYWKKSPFEEKDDYPDADLSYLNQLIREYGTSPYISSGFFFDERAFPYIDRIPGFYFTDPGAKINKVKVNELSNYYIYTMTNNFGLKETDDCYFVTYITTALFQVDLKNANIKEIVDNLRNLPYIYVVKLIMKGTPD